MSQPSTPSQSFKVILIGDSGVGKTSILFRYCRDSFDEDRSPTVGIANQPIQISPNIKLSVWDTAGQEKFQTLTKTYYRNCNAAILTYDITRRDTFNNLKTHWLPELKDITQNFLTVIIGNKLDLRTTLPDSDSVTRQEGEAFASEQSAMFAEVSAKTAEQVKELFQELADRLLEGTTSSPETKHLQLTQEANKDDSQGSRCC